MSETNLNLYNVQFMIEKHGKLVNKFVYALDKDDAKQIVFDMYKNFEFDKSQVYCQKVNILRGMYFNN